MNTHNKIYLMILLASIFSLGTVTAIATDDFIIKKKDDTYILTSGDKTAKLYTNWWYGLNKFSVTCWPGGIENDIQGKKLKILALAFLKFNKKKFVSIDYEHKTNDQDIDIFLAALLKKHCA